MHHFIKNRKNMNHTFEVSDAIEHGVECAIILSNLRFWIDKNRANQRHFYDGHYWTYNTLAAWVELFPYWTADQLRRYIEKLQKKGVIITGNYNENAYNRAKWIRLNCQIEMANSPNGKGELAKSTTYSKPNSKTDSKQRASEESRFSEFWASYPRKESKPQALKFWAKKNLDEIAEKIITHVNASKKSDAWTEKEGKYIPHASTYLNNERYNDPIKLSKDAQFLMDMGKLNNNPPTFENL